jgi:sphingomyelin phosphodiesterase
LFKQCVIDKKGSESKCDNVDFFVNTDTKNFQTFNSSFNSGIQNDGAVNFYDNDFLHLLKNFNVSSDLDLTYYCYFKHSACSLPETPDVEELYDIQSWWPKKQAIHENEPQYPKRQGSSSNSSDTFNIIHITDLHTELRYKLGSEANCSKPICCLPESVNSDLPKLKSYNFTDYYNKVDSNASTVDFSFYPDAHYDDSGKYIKGDYYDYPKARGWAFVNSPATSFGAYACDSPELLINNTLKSIKSLSKEKNFEFSIFTGDLVDHDVIHCSPEVTKTAEIKTFNLMKHYLGNISVFPSLGNHDTFPYGQLAHLGYGFNNSYQWNTELMAELWINNGWLNGTNKTELVNHYAGFSYVTKRGLKVIALNSNCYYQKNLWSYINLEQTPDPFGQWKFLVDELVKSESKGQRVWIMAHIPPNDPDALPIQSQIFHKIVERFSPYTIAGIFYGHTHRDEFSVAYKWGAEQNVKNAVNMAWTAPSVIPDSVANPSWRYYEVDKDSFNIINSYSYYTKLNDTFINGGAEPVWSFEYSARDVYDPKGEWPTDAPLNATFWHSRVVENLKNQSNIVFNQKYTDLRYRRSPFTPDCANGTIVSNQCHDENFCVTSNFYSYNYTKCLRDD